MKLHMISGSPNVWRVMLLLEYKELDYELLRIDPTTWDREQSGFYELNPRGKVPVLEDGEHLVYESIASVLSPCCYRPVNQVKAAFNEQICLLRYRAFLEVEFC